MWRLIYFIPVLFFVFLVGLMVWALGLILIPIACACRAYVKLLDVADRPSDKQKDGSIYSFTWPFMWPWDNDTSDGICCRNYYQSPFKQYGYLDMIVTTFVWSAIRNPINNFKRWISPKYNFHKLKSFGKPYGYNYKNAVPCWYLIWQGPFGGFYWSFKFFGQHRYIKIGYKLRPYLYEKQIPESQKNGVGYTFRIIPKTIKE